MEQVLRCNNLKCRSELQNRALVTTCSHIYCVDCANHSGLTSQDPHQRICPACKSQLLGPDDVVFNNLHPSEDYKISVLSGLNPNTVMECAGKALSFWAYQMTQELVYQEHLCKTLTDRYSDMSVHLDKVINEANGQITALQNKIQGNLRRKNDELVQAFKDKNKKLLQTQELYDKLKRKAMLGQMRDAASDVVISSIEAAAASGTTLGDQLSRTNLYDQHESAPIQDLSIGPGRGGPSGYLFGASGPRSQLGAGPGAISTGNWNKPRDNRGEWQPDLQEIHP
ncbi:hypothetical protein GQ53DRAFT_738742 [Thozetella sp. PMI_491]|nr:hypothetical protein GQ53DRAFT_738742 [Thozetella sp. PMI_491]